MIIALIVAIATGLYALWIITDPTDVLEDIHCFYPAWVENAMGAVGLLCLIVCPVSVVTFIVLLTRSG